MSELDFGTKPVTLLCLASYFKGTTFLTAAKQAGCRVVLVTREKLHNESWPWDSIDDVFYMPQLSKQPDIIYAIAYFMRGKAVDQIIPLDDYDVLTVAALREHFRLPNMGETVSRHFRDKLAMRMKARQEKFKVPEFTAVFNYDQLREFMGRVPPPWLLKPRAEAGAMGIKRMDHSEMLWRKLDELGDLQSYFLLEQFVAGPVYHVDAIVWQGKVVFATAHQYLQPPIDVAHDGGVFVTRTMPRQAKETKALVRLHNKLILSLGMERGVAHTEFIKGEDGEFYFLETAARVGGANIEQLVEASSGINLWAEWARLETAALRSEAYQIPEDKSKYAGIMICLARQEWPDLSGYQDPEIVHRVNKKQHAGLIVASPQHERIEQLIQSYSQRFVHDFLAVAPPLDTAPT
ncbi:ATP-grasp domain-containing protein [Candidatus Leptofilum sp.]|uniref:ATP-grasp domain-containing protein n=1 Tax=Candidatus Leptofilum sp. TaxID=3241576 RepID=UPI003B5A4034